MLFGRKKPGFLADDKITSELNQEPQTDLLGYLESLPEVEDEEFGDVNMQKMQEETIELTKSQQIADYIRLRTQGVQLSSHTDLAAEIEDFEELIRQWETDVSCHDIAKVQGKKDIYYYSVQYMSDNYAMIAALVAENDLAWTIASMVRFNCQTYPVPTPFSYFERSPYLATVPQIERSVLILQKGDEYQDIQILNNNAGDKFFFSTESMSFRYAKALADVEEYID